MKKKNFLLAIFLTLFLSGCGQKTSLTEQQPIVSPDPVKEMISIEIVARHNIESDCWIIINNNVYNMTDFINIHPGGKVMVESCGQNATALFEVKPGSGQPHSDKAQQLLEKYYLGELQN